MPTKEIMQVEKLPKWAQDHIGNLERQVREHREMLKKFNDTQTPSLVWTEEHPCLNATGGPTEIRHYLQTDRVTFNVGDEEVEVRVVDGRLSVHAAWHKVVVVPEVTNHIYVEVRR